MNLVLVPYASSEGSGEPTLLAHLRYGHSRRLRPISGPLAPLDSSTSMFEDLFYKYAISTRISGAGSIEEAS